MLKQWNIFFYFIMFIVLLNLQLIQSQNLRYLTKPSKRMINQEQQSNFIKQSNTKKQKENQFNSVFSIENELHQLLIDSQIPIDLISSYLTSKELYNYAHVNHETFNSPDIKKHYIERIKEGYKLIEKAKNHVGGESSQPAEELKNFLDTLPHIPTEYVTYAYNNNKKEALRLLVKYKVTFDM